MLKALIWSTLIAMVWSDCDVCHTANPIACHDERRYSLCSNGSPSHDYVSCPIDYICTSEPHICLPRERATPSCPPVSLEGRCGICSPQNRIFSCLNETTIAFCFGKDAPDMEALAYCPENTVCDLENEQDFCSLADTAEPSCREKPTEPPTEEPTTEETIPRDPLTFCREKATAGSYKPDGDTECKRFILCYIIDDVWHGSFHPCPDNEFFDDVILACSTSKPDNCD